MSALSPCPKRNADRLRLLPLRRPVEGVPDASVPSRRGPLALVAAALILVAAGVFRGRDAGPQPPAADAGTAPPPPGPNEGAPVRERHQPYPFKRVVVVSIGINHYPKLRGTTDLRFAVSDAAESNTLTRPAWGIAWCWCMSVDLGDAGPVLLPRVERAAQLDVRLVEVDGPLARRMPDREDEAHLVEVGGLDRPCPCNRGKRSRPVVVGGEDLRRRVEGDVEGELAVFTRRPRRARRRACGMSSRSGAAMPKREAPAAR